MPPGRPGSTTDQAVGPQGARLLRKGNERTRERRARLGEEEEINPRTPSTAAKQALRMLTGQHREIIVETYFHGRSLTDAARLLGIPLETARSRLYYAMRELTAATRGLADR
ncbi:MAG TPA: sigma factor-like helix-turn-helix DNA-binding protein [Catenuloplanes sp.]|jgi:RNA polymerase sigma-70 factor (ECF subfamily)